MILDILGRYWRKVDRKGPDQCWIWKGARTTGGYGQLANGRTNRNRPERSLATHIALAIDGRARPDSNHVAMHLCDNPTCVNPAHLRWGTMSENRADMIAKGRSAQQQRAATALDASALQIGRNRHHAAKLNSKLVCYIRSSTKTTIDLADELGVTNQCISNVRTGRTWSRTKIDDPSDEMLD